MNFIKVFTVITIFILFSHKSFYQILKFDNPIAEQRADPWVYKTDDGIYYLIATVPEYNRIVLRKADSINDLKGATEKDIRHKHEMGLM